MDLEHFMESFFALLSNQEPNLWVPEAMEEEKEEDFVSSLMSIVVDDLWRRRCPDPDPAESGRETTEGGADAASRSMELDSIAKEGSTMRTLLLLQSKLSSMSYHKKRRLFM